MTIAVYSNTLALMFVAEETEGLADDSSVAGSVGRSGEGTGVERTMLEVVTGRAIVEVRVADGTGTLVESGASTVGRRSVCKYYNIHVVYLLRMNISLSTLNTIIIAI